MSIITSAKDTPDYARIFVVLSTVFFMWGLITGLNFFLADELMIVFQLDLREAMAMNLLFFGTYFIVSMPAGKIIDMIGYRKGMVAGLVISAIGCFLSYPAAGMQSYGLYMVSLFILASGITMLQVAANPYVALLGSDGKGAMKLTFVQAFNSLGASLPPLFATALIFKIANLSEEKLQSMSPDEIKSALVRSVQEPYIILGSVLCILAVFLYFSKLPRIQTANLEPLVQQSGQPKKYAWQFPHLILGAIAIFAYVGAEVTIGRYLTLHAEDLAKYYWAGAMVGRFAGVGILKFMSARKSIGIFSLVASCLVMYFVFVTDNPSLWSLVAVGLFNSILFPCIFTLGVDGLGKFSEEGSAILIMGIVGGAVIPYMVGTIDTKMAFAIPALCYIYIAYYGFVGSRYIKKDIPAV